MSYWAALVKMVEYEPKKLIRYAYCYNGERCAVGALCPSLKSHDLFTIGGAKDITSELGLTLQEIKATQIENDSFVGTAEARYRHMVEWLRRKAAKERG